MEIESWDRGEWWRNKHSVHELIRIYNEHHRRDNFFEVVNKYPYWKELLEGAVRLLMYRTDYEFLVARLRESKEIVGWIAFSFVSEGNETIGRRKFDANMEQTEMCSHILETWKVESSGVKSNVWEEIKRRSSSLQAKYLPPDHCIINALVYCKHEQFKDIDIAGALLESVIWDWRNMAMTRTEWAIWVQAPASAQLMYEEHDFEEVGEYNIEIGNYGVFPQEDVSGKYGWKFMVRRETNASAIDRRLAELILDTGKGKQQDLDDRPPDEESQSQTRESSDDEDDPLQRYAWESADRRLKAIRTGQGNPALSGEVESLMRVKRNAEAKGYRPPSQSNGKQSEKQEEIAGPAPRAKPPAPPLQGTTTVTSQPQDNFTPSKSEEDLIEAMKKGGVDE